MRAKVILLTCILSAILCTNAAAKIIYVDDDANGINNGTSWDNAYIYLQDALTNAEISLKPVEIRVAQGTYKPDLGAGITRGDREATFLLIDNVNLVGGYAGLGQADPNARDIELYETILSGDLNSNDTVGTSTPILFYEPNRADNSYRVITSNNIGDTTSIDGFIITAGNANGTSYQNGGGIYIDHSYLAVTNCTFLKNSAYQGGGVYNYYNNPKFINCTFSENLAENNGGGIYNYHGAPNITDCIFSGNVSGEDGSGMCNYYSNSILTDCTFNWNVSQSDGGGIYNDHSNPAINDCLFCLNLTEYDGGGIYNYYSNSTYSNCIFIWNVSEDDGGGICNSRSNPLLVNCTFNSNVSQSDGGGIYNYYDSSPTLISCMFNANLAYSGGGLHNYNNSNPTITNCTFSENIADNRGAGMYNYSYSNPTITDCTFSGNMADYYGGGMSNYSNSNPTITNCTFTGNSSDSYGGGMYNYSNSNPTITNCTFNLNSANDGGGICNNNNSNPILSDCTFSGNLSTNYGGGIYNYTNSSPSLTNCTIKMNFANNGGGMSNNSNCNPTLTNCTFSRNSSGSNGGGIYNYTNSNPTLANCIFSRNASENHGGGMYNQSSNPALSNCSFSRNNAKDDGGGIYNILSSIPSIETCLFSENTAGNNGGAMYNDKSAAKLMNCTFSGNQAVAAGGGTYNTDNSNIIVVNCTFAGNLSPCGNAINCYSGGPRGVEKLPSIVELKNCILWDESEQIWNDKDSTITIAYCDVNSGQSTAYDPKGKIIWGECNIDTDPCFADPGYWNTNGTTDDSNDDFWVEGDYHLKSQAGRFDLNCQSWVIDDVTSLCVDAGDPNSPIYYEPVPNGGLINMGAYGGTSEASKSLYDIEYFDHASNPNPADSAVDVALDAKLNWISDINAVMHEVYFGTSEYPPFVTKLYGTEFEPGSMKPNTQYYWRIDEVDNSLNRVIGNTWTFLTGSQSSHPSNPYPEDGAINVVVSTILSWTPSSNADTFDVYFGTDYDDVNEATITNTMGMLFAWAQEPNFCNPGILAYDESYFWRVDERDSSGTITKGYIWAFITEEQQTKGRSCFPAETPVWVDGKMVEISKVVAGQMVGKTDCAMSISGTIKRLEEHSAGVNPCYEMTLESGNTITIVHSHYFKIISGEWKKIEELSAGMQLQSINGPIAIKNVVKKEMPFLGASYNLILNGSEQYFVGLEGVAALDCSKKTWEILEKARQ